MSAVLDASAFLAYLNGEPGADEVVRRLPAGALISAVNLCEVYSKVAERGGDPQRLEEALRDRRILGGAVEVAPFTRADAVIAAELRPLTKSQGLSLGDRACLALGKRLGLAVLTADAAWDKVPAEVAVAIVQIAR
jgi:PIN domain nuclease of toxin-antitoxin system